MIQISSKLETISTLTMSYHQIQGSYVTLSNSSSCFFFCRQGQENLYDMTKEHFELCVEPDGTEFVIQKLDEKDKNHGIKDTEIPNQAKMYSAPGTKNNYFSH